MHRSFGMETRATSLQWKDVSKGPSLADVRAHVTKLGSYAMMAGRTQENVIRLSVVSKTSNRVSEVERIAA